MRATWVLPAIFAFLADACSRSPAPTPVASSTSTPAGTTMPVDAQSALADQDASSAIVVDAAPARVHPERAFALPADASCHDDLRCLVDHAYARDEKARALALALFDETGDVAGTDHEQTMDGGFRGTLHIVPDVPTGEGRVQLERVLASARDFESFFQRLRSAKPSSTPTPAYRWRDLTFRFFRSRSGPRDHEVERTTPSAYAIGPRPMPRSIADDISFSLAYNLKGSLLTTEAGVRETLFHEVFHMNDAAHGDPRDASRGTDGWSARALAADYDAIVKKCGATNVACLAPYAPNDTKVRSGTYYAFEQNNGVPVREYAAELALRWYKEHRALQRGEPPPFGKAFKCGPPKNRRSWDAIVKEFFAFDLVPPCP